MGHIPVARAQALPGRDAVVAHSSPWQAVSRHARERGDQPAFLLLDDGVVTTRTWSEAARVVERAAAGLVRSGLRVDQVIVSLLPSDHAYPELELALRTVGAVVVHVGPTATPAEVVRDLGHVQVRLVIAESAEDLDRVQGLDLARTELFTLDGGRGWARLLELGSKRLVMDPTVVDRTDRSVDQRGAGPRLLDGRVRLGQAPVTALRAGVLDGRAVVLAAGDAADPLLRVVRESHVVLGFALCVVREADLDKDTLRAVHPHAVVVPAHAVDALLQAVPGEDVFPRTRSRRSLGRRSGHPRTSAARPPSTRGPIVVTPAITDAARDLVGRLGGAVEVVEMGELLPPDLPEPPPVVLGDIALLPRRSRRAPGDEFELRLGVEPEPDESAFSLPSLPLLTGESVLDQLLLARAPAPHK